MPSRPGVAIVGAGPAGLVVAHLLQREAIPFVVFERQTLAELACRPKAGLVEYRTVQLLAREGIAGSVLQFTTENHRSEFRTPDESVLLEYARLRRVITWRSPVPTSARTGRSNGSATSWRPAWESAGRWMRRWARREFSICGSG